MKKDFAILLVVFALLMSANAFAAPEGVSELNELLRGERSAVETYQQALKKVGDEPGSDKLRAALAQHEVAVKTITAEIVRLGGSPSADSGAWGMWAQTVVGSAKLLGDSAALKALKEGEEHGIDEYKEMLEDDDVPANFKLKIRDTLIPRQQEHIASIDSMMNAIDRRG